MIPWARSRASSPSTQLRPHRRSFQTSLRTRDTVLHIRLGLHFFVVTRKLVFPEITTTDFFNVTKIPPERGILSSRREHPTTTLYSRDDTPFGADSCDILAACSSSLHKDAGNSLSPESSSVPILVLHPTHTKGPHRHCPTLYTRSPPCIFLTTWPSETPGKLPLQLP